MARDWHHPQPGSHEHHAALGRPTELGQELGMSGIVVTGID